MRVHRYVQRTSDDANADAALSDFKRFPQWMWRNTVVLEFIEWLREWNGAHMRERCGDDAFLIGFSTHSGTVTAASDWDAPAERKGVRARHAR